jgi:hypothetical protein
MRGVDDDRRAADRGIEPKPAEELVAVHHGHEHVRDHEVGLLLLHGQQRLGAIRGLARPVSFGAQKGDEKFPIGADVINDQDGRHRRCLGGVSATGGALVGRPSMRFWQGYPFICRVERPADGVEGCLQ